MSIKIRKYEGGEVFDLPSGYVIEGEKNNPVFEKKGSQTVPIALPATIKNNRLLNFPFRLDRSERQEETTRVIVEAGSSQQMGLLSVNSASPKSISSTIGYDESEMYVQFGTMQLRDIPELPVLDFGGNNISERVDSVLFHLTAVMKQQVDTDYYVFPVLLKYEFVTEENVTKSYTEILNDIDTNIIYPDSPNGRIAELKALSNRSIIRYENGEEIEISAPKGYGVSPFLKVYRILELIFEHYKFKLTENPFKDHRQLKKMVVLNNCMDTILTGKLSYKDLMPDITIQDFLDSLFAKFGMLYFVDSNSRTVRIKFLKDIITNGDVDRINLTKFKNNDPNISFSSPKQLRLKMNRDNESTEILANTFEEFLEQYNNQFTDSFSFNEPGTGVNVNGRISQVFRKYHSRYVVLNIFNIETTEYYTSSDFFDWDKKTSGIAYEDIEMKDLCIPFSDIIGYSIQNTMGYPPYYSVGIKHLYTEIVVNGQSQNNVENPSKLAFLFGWGLTKHSEQYRFNYFFASQFNQDINGYTIKDEQNNEYDISLTCNRVYGLYNRFWKEYDAFIRHSNQEVNCDIHLSDLELMNFKIDNQVIIDNQPYIARQIKYKLNTSDKISEWIFRTIRHYEPHSEIEIIEYYPQKYFWAYTVSYSEDPPTTNVLSRIIIWNKYYTINGVQYPKTNLSLLPPTSLSDANRIYQYIIQYKIFGLPVITKNIIVTIEFYPEKVIS